MARTAAWVRSETPSLLRILRTCALTVLTLKRRFWAIWGFVWPWLRSFSTSTSLGVRLSNRPSECSAAVSDFAPASRVQEKIRRGEGGLSLELEPTADVLKAIRERYPDLFVVGFAATHGGPVADAREKLGSKGADLVVGNDISLSGIGFGADENEVYVVGREDERFVPRTSKREVARVILDSMLTEMGKER